jgi:hypothetical protein
MQKEVFGDDKEETKGEHEEKKGRKAREAAEQVRAMLCVMPP